jgi:hypothetical protein
MTDNLKRLAYKYRSPATLARDLAGLQQSRIYAAPRDQLNDPFEGRFDRTTLDGQFRVLKAFLGQLKKELGSSLGPVEGAVEELVGFVDKSGIFSLSYTPLDELLWAHYGGSHQGYCVAYDLETLVEFDPQNLHRLEVEYVDAAPSLHGNDFFPATGPEVVLRKLLGTKSTPWRYEQEVRVIATPPGPHEHDFRAVKEVYFGLRCSEETRLAVMKCLAGRGVVYKQVRSPEPAYRLVADVIPDAFPDAPPHLLNEAPLADCAILTDYLKPEHKQYADYVGKAAEIVRRDPYCAEVQTVDVSGERRAGGHPEIYVHFVRPSGKLATRYLSVAQIDEQYGRWRA